MESFLLPEDRVCFVCRQSLQFRQSRFGCIFTCACGRHIDFQKALERYCLRLQQGDNHLSFVPMIEGSKSDGTRTLKVLCLELLYHEERLLLQFKNLSPDQQSDILLSLSHALREQMVVGEGSAQFPSCLVDILTTELYAACGTVTPCVYINAPPDSVVEAVRNKEVCSDHLFASIPDALRIALLNHQANGVRKILQWGGRALIADEMGVGKTLQALGAVAALDAFPTLIVCPSALKCMWAEEVEKYLYDRVGVADIHVISGANGALRDDHSPKVVLISYHMVGVLGEQLQRRSWKCVVCDESHTLHTTISASDAVYTKVLVEMGKRAPYCLLLTGTPALTTPFDMFNQVDILCPGFLGESRLHFAVRYCHLQVNPYLKVLGCTRSQELRSLLLGMCMLRRQKSEVLELPAKRRVLLRVHDAGLDACAVDSPSFQSLYAANWRQKLRGIVEAVDYCCSKYNNVVLFAHHILLLDRLEEYLRRRRISSVRIDGSVVPDRRGGLLKTFSDGAVRVCIVGITACAVGISLTAAHCALFCELPPDAAWMSQAEDRLHRAGQAREVTIFYVLGIHSSFDARHFSWLQSSFQCVHSITDDDEASLSVSNTTRTSLTMSYTDVQPDSSPAVAPTSVSLLFSISKHTGRVHVKNSENNFYMSLPREECSNCVRSRNHVVWGQLRQFLLSLSRHSPFHQRQIIMSGEWLPCDFTWRRPREVSGIRQRYAAVHNASCRWGFWWFVKRRFFASSYYWSCLTCDGNFLPCCLCCSDVMQQAGNFRPGCVVETQSDIALFCGGRCRKRYFMQRSASAIRQDLSTVDRGVCSHCHVDCEELCTLVSQQRSMKKRERIAHAYHPYLMQFPALLRRFIEHPTRGNCWHADHITPVSQGGGLATTDNLQTLCVACHALKTREEAKAPSTFLGSMITAPTSAQCMTTVDYAKQVFTSGTRQRVTRRRVNA